MYDSSEWKRIASNPTKLRKLKPVHVKIRLCSHVRTPLKGGEREIGGWGQREREREVYVSEKLLYCTAMQMAEGERIDEARILQKKKCFIRSPPYCKDSPPHHRRCVSPSSPLTEGTLLLPHPSHEASLV